MHTLLLWARNWRWQLMLCNLFSYILALYWEIELYCTASAYRYLATVIYLLTACLATSFLFMSFVYITCICLRKKDHLWQPKQVRRTTFGCHACKNGPPAGPVSVAKFGPARTTIGKGRPFLATKSSSGGPQDHYWKGETVFASQNQSGDRTDFRVTVHLK